MPKEWFGGLETPQAGVALFDDLAGPANLETPNAPNASSPVANDITFTPLGATADTASWWIYIRNELLASNHPDASFMITVGGLTGFVSSNDKVTLQ